MNELIFDLMMFNQNGITDLPVKMSYFSVVIYTGLVYVLQAMSTLVRIHFKKAFLFQSHAVSLCVIGFEYFCFHSHYKQLFQIYPPGKASSKISVSAGQKRHLSVDGRPKCREKAAYSNVSRLV